MNHASTFPCAGDSAVPLFPAVVGEYVRNTEDTVPSRSVVTACMPSRMSERSVGIESADPACVFVPHPIQDRTDAEMRTIADDAVDAMLRALTTPGG